MIRVGIVDDQALLVSAFKALIETAPDMTVVGTAGDGAAALELVAAIPMDVLLLDVQMPGLDGIGAVGQIASSPNSPAVLMLTTFNIDEYVTAALHNGARGFILKDADPSELLGAIRSVHGGQTVLSNEAAAHLAAALGDRTPGGVSQRTPMGTTQRDGSHPDAESTLTRREQQVLELIGQGLTNPEIARKLYIAQTTVKSHVSNLLLKLDCRDRVGLAILANQHRKQT